MTHERSTVIRTLAEQPQIPVLILGGGVNGIGLFRELALQGVDCLLVDKADFVSGASSKSSRMIHGGLRYLETREVKLVRESLRERNRLLENAAHYVTPLKTTIPLFSWLGGMIRSTLLFLGFRVRPGDRGVLITRIGLVFYDFVTRKNRRTPKHYLTSKARSLERLPGLNPKIVATATYWDACISEAERLCIEMIRDAEAVNPRCHALNYVPMERAAGRTITFTDEVTGRQFTVEPQIVVNATGAWVDLTNAVLGLKTHFIGGTKGSHLVVDNKELHNAVGDQMVYYQHVDGRVCIVFTFMGKTIMGSTDIPVDDPETAACDEAEIGYMLTTLRGVFPGVTIRREDIVHVFCGVRPLPASGTEVTAIISRGHSIRTIEPEAEQPFPVYCLIGGKWTTFRAFAELVADRVLARLGIERRTSTEHTPIGGGRDFPEGEEGKARWVERVAQESGLSVERVSTLLARYGTDAEAYAAGETPLKSLPDYSVGEIERIAAAEQVVHLADVVCRRTLIGILGRATAPALEELAGIVGKVLGWDQATREREVRLTLAELAAPTRP